MADTGDENAPVTRRILFKKTIKPRKPKDGTSGDALSLFEHSKTSFARLVEEKQRHLEEEKRKKKLAQEESHAAHASAGSAQNNRTTRSPSAKGSNRVGSSPPKPQGSRKRKSDTFDEDSDDDEKANSCRKASQMTGALPVGYTPTKALRASPGKPISIVDSDDSVDHFLKSSSKKPKLPKTSPRSQRDAHLPTPTTPVISLDDNDDEDNDPFDVKPSQGKDKDKPSEEDELAGMDPDIRRFIEQAKQRREKSKAGDKPATVHVLVTSNIPNTVDLIAELRLNQETKILRKTWAFKNNIEQDLIFLTFRGNRIYDFATCQALRITATEDKQARPEDDDSFRRYRGDGFKQGMVLFEAWTAELFREHERQKEEEKRQLRGEFRDRDFFGDDMEQEEALVTKIRISLKAKTGDPVKVTVRPATTVKELVASFRTKRELGNDKEVWINFDGDRLDDHQTVEELEIEDKDVLDVIVKD